MTFDIKLNPNEIKLDHSIQTISLVIKPDQKITHLTISVSYPSGILPKGETRFKIPEIEKEEKIERELKVSIKDSIDLDIEKDVSIKLVGRDSSGKPIRNRLKKSLSISNHDENKEEVIKKPDIKFETVDQIKGKKDTYQFLSVDIKNVGEGTARKLMALLEGPISGEQKKKIKSLGPSEKKKLEFSIKPYISGEGEISIKTYFMDEEGNKKTIQREIPIKIKKEKQEETSKTVYSAEEINLHEDKSVTVKDNSKKVTDQSTKIQDSVVLNKKGDIGGKDKKNRNDKKKDIPGKKTCCPNCGKEIDPSWKFCVYCKENIKEVGKDDT